MRATGTATELVSHDILIPAPVIVREARHRGKAEAEKGGDEPICCSTPSKKKRKKKQQATYVRGLAKTELAIPECPSGKEGGGLSRPCRSMLHRSAAGCNSLENLIKTGIK